jgi:Na+-driven multidrug efflux pump
MAIIGRVSNPETVLAAYGVGDKLINIIFIVVDGLGTGIVTLIGQNLGANLINRVIYPRQTGHYCRRDSLSCHLYFGHPLLWFNRSNYGSI